jgi:hypothetical protein
MFLFSLPSFITVTVLFIVNYSLLICVLYFLFVPVTMIYDKQSMIMYFFFVVMLILDTDLVVFELGILKA